MKKSIFLSCLIAVTLVGTLYSLPKVVVNNKAKEIGTEQNTVTATAQPEQASTDMHNGAILPPDQQKIVDELKNGFLVSEGTEKVAAGIKLSDKFRSLQKFDSAAVYAAKVSDISGSIENLMRTADRYYDAFGFATDDAKSKTYGAKTREYYQKALDLNPGLLTAKANMAMTYVNTENPMQGIMMLREIIDVEPTNEMALFNLGILSIRSNQYSKAADRFRQILTNNPTNSKAKFYLGLALVELGNKSEATKILAEVKRVEKDPVIQQAIVELEARLQN